jgi:tRNA nucleotidyltransferase/poly(A) polymerase
MEANMDGSVEKIIRRLSGEGHEGWKNPGLLKLRAEGGLLCGEGLAADPDNGPLFALQAVRIASELGCGLSERLAGELKLMATPPRQSAKSRLREEFSGAITPPGGALGLRLAIQSGLIPHLLGEGLPDNAKSPERSEFLELAEKLDLARPEAEYRWALILRRFDRKLMQIALEGLFFDKRTEETLLKAILYTDKIYFLNTKLELKRFIKKCGYSDYHFMDRIARQEKKIFGRQDLKIENRLYIIEEIRARGEPMAVEDLAIGKDELIAGGLCRNAASCERMLSALLDIAIIDPGKNKANILLKEAERINRNPLLILINKVNWIK